MSNRPKVLLMGHSWVKYIQEVHMRHPIEDLELNFAFEEGIRIDGLIEMVPIVVTPEHTHILLFSLLTDALCMQSIDPQRGGKSQYQVLLPNQNFQPDYFAQRMNVFTECCKMINPEIKIILMIPPVTDLVYHNRIRVEAYPQMVQRSYMKNPQFDDHMICMAMMDLHSTMMVLKTKQFMWMDKKTYPMQIVAQNTHPTRNRIDPFMKGEVVTLGKFSHLCDGFHPTTVFIQKMWERLRNTTLLEAPTFLNVKQNNFIPQKAKVKKRRFNSADEVMGEPSHPNYDTSPSFAVKKLPCPPAPPQLSINRVHNTQHKQHNEESNSYPLPHPSQSIDSNVGSVSSSDNVQPRTTLQLVDMNYMVQEIDKFASFMAGHAHAVGQNLSIKEIKQMMITVLQDKQ